MPFVEIMLIFCCLESQSRKIMAKSSHRAPLGARHCAQDCVTIYEVRNERNERSASMIQFINHLFTTTPFSRRIYRKSFHINPS
jgi:hypothetical protein